MPGVFNCLYKSMAVWIDSQARAQKKKKKKKKKQETEIYTGVKVYKQTVHLQIKYLSL